MLIIKCTLPISKENACKLLAIRTYDTALPQQWLNDITEKTGADYHLVLSSVVWCYDISPLGVPRPLTKSIIPILNNYDKIKGFHYMDNENYTVLDI